VLQPYTENTIQKNISILNSNPTHTNTQLECEKLECIQCIWHTNRDCIYHCQKHITTKTLQKLYKYKWKNKSQLDKIKNNDNQKIHL